MDLSPPQPPLGFFSQICSCICTMLCSTFWSPLARGFSPFCLAEGHHLLQEGATGEECKWGGGSRGLVVWSKLISWLWAQPSKTPCTWGPNSDAFKTSPCCPAPPNYVGHHGHFPWQSTRRSWGTTGHDLSLIWDIASYFATFSFILSVKDLY